MRRADDRKFIIFHFPQRFALRYTWLRDIVRGQLKCKVNSAGEGGGCLSTCFSIRSNAPFSLHYYRERLAFEFFETTFRDDFEKRRYSADRNNLTG